MAFLRQRGWREQEIAVRAHAALFGARLDPLLRFFEFLHDHERQRGGGRAGEEHITPGAGNHAGLFQLAHADADEGREHIAYRRKRLDGAERVGARPIRNGFGNHGNADRELAADSEAA